MKATLFTLSLFLLVLYYSCAQQKKGFELSGSNIPVEELKDGGPPRDGIPSIDSPKFIQAEKTKIADEGRVLGVYHNDIAKAYPIPILNFHEIVNDFFGDQPIVVTFCPLCGSGIAFDTMIDGERKTFGVSGLLYNSDVLLYDRQTESLWSQLMGEAVTGPMNGKKLEMIPTSNTTWEHWKEMHPNTLVLSEDTGFTRDYTKNPYTGYAQSTKLYFEVSEKDNRFHPKEMVMGLEINGKHKAYPLSELAKSNSTETKDNFQGKEILIRYNPKSKSAEAVGPDGKILPTVLNFWFAWYAFYPDTAVYEHE